MFIWSAIAHLVALTSPGPDTLIVIRESSINGRSGGIKAAIGIGIGIYFHCLLAINGISLILLSDPTLSKSIGVIGGLYLIYIGLTMFIHKSNEKTKRTTIRLPFAGKSHHIPIFSFHYSWNIFNNN